MINAPSGYCHKYAPLDIAGDKSIARQLLRQLNFDDSGSHQDLGRLFLASIVVKLTTLFSHEVRNTMQRGARDHHPLLAMIRHQMNLTMECRDKTIAQCFITFPLRGEYAYDPLEEPLHKKVVSRTMVIRHLAGSKYSKKMWGRDPWHRRGRIRQRR